MWMGMGMEIGEAQRGVWMALMEGDCDGVR